MLWRCTLLLALCAFGCVRSMTYPNPIKYRYGGGPGYPCTPECYAMIRQWFMQQGCQLPYGMGYGTGGTGVGGYYGTTRDPYGPQHVYIDYTNSYGQIESLKVSGPCFAYQLCDKCGPYGQCVVEAYSQPECKCKEGYAGDKCDQKIPDGQNNVIIAVTVIAGLLAFFILVAVIVHICWKHKGHNHWKKRNCVQVVTPGQHCGPVNHCGPAPSHGHPSLKATCNVCPSGQLRIHAATPNHGSGHQHYYPPVVGGQCCPPRSSVKITEIVEDNPQGGAVVPVGGGLFGGIHQSAGPNVYTTIGPAPAGGTTITL